MPNFQYIDLPPVPESLYTDVYKSLRNPSYNTTEVRRYYISEATQSIYDFISTIFEPWMYDTVNIQLIRKDMPWHIDGRRTEVYNYLLSTGNPNVKTNYKNESIVIEPYRWHRLDTSVLHNVTGMQPGNARLAICVFNAINKSYTQNYSNIRKNPNE
jgi:hypothetical protein